MTSKYSHKFQTLLSIVKLYVAVLAVNCSEMWKNLAGESEEGLFACSLNYRRILFSLESTLCLDTRPLTAD